MEKELLEKRKVALKKLLNNKQYFCFGLCHLINGLSRLNILTLDEYIILDELIDSYFKNSEEARKAFIRYRGFMWEPGEWEPREDWIINTIESIDLMLNQSKTT